MATSNKPRSSREILIEALLLQDLISNLRDEGVLYLARKFDIDHEAAAKLMLEKAGVTRGQLRLAQKLVEDHNSKILQRSGKLSDLSELPALMTLADAIRKVGRVPGISAYEAIRLAQPSNTGSSTGRLNAFARLSLAPDGLIWSALMNHQRGSQFNPRNEFFYGAARFEQGALLAA